MSSLINYNIYIHILCVYIYIYIHCPTINIGTYVVHESLIWINFLHLETSYIYLYSLSHILLSSSSSYIFRSLSRRVEPLPSLPTELLPPWDPSLPVSLVLLFPYLSPSSYIPHFASIIPVSSSDDPTIEEDLLDLSINEGPHKVFNELAVVGAIISDKILNFRAIKAILMASWNLGPRVQISALDRNVITCSFNSASDKDRILRNSPWAVKGHIIVFLTWSPTSTLAELDFSHSPF